MKGSNATMFIVENDEHIPVAKFDSLKITTEEDIRWQRYHEKYCFQAPNGEWYPYNWIGDIPG